MKPNKRLAAGIAAALAVAGVGAEPVARPQTLQPRLRCR